MSSGDTGLAALIGPAAADTLETAWLRRELSATLTQLDYKPVTGSSRPAVESARFAVGLAGGWQTILRLEMRDGVPDRMQRDLGVGWEPLSFPDATYGIATINEAAALRHTVSALAGHPPAPVPPTAEWLFGSWVGLLAGEVRVVRNLLQTEMGEDVWTAQRETDLEISLAGTSRPTVLRLVQLARKRSVDGLRVWHWDTQIELPKTCRTPLGTVVEGSALDALQYGARLGLLFAAAAERPLKIADAVRSSPEWSSLVMQAAARGGGIDVSTDRERLTADMARSALWAAFTRGPIGLPDEHRLPWKIEAIGRWRADEFVLDAAFYASKQAPEPLVQARLGFRLTLEEGWALTTVDQVG